MSTTVEPAGLEGRAVPPARDRLVALVDDPGARAAAPAAELTDLVLARIAEVDGELNAYMTVMAAAARADARRIDAGRDGGERLPLDGMPVAVKDNIAVAGVRCAVGSRLFADRIAAHDAEVVRRLRAAGAVIVGKSATHELVFGATGHNALTGWTHNPYNLARLPGGSSAGSGAALGADAAVGALGSDTGGSVRMPAHFNGITGLRPTYGAVSQRGAFPVGPSFDTVGPMARAARDVAALHAVIAGPDPADPRSALRETPLDGLGGAAGVAGLAVGVPGGFFAEGLGPGVAAAVRRVADTLAALGADVREVDVPGAAGAAALWRRIVNTEARAVHRDAFAATPERFGADVAALLAAGGEVSGPELAHCLGEMHAWRMEVRGHFAAVDLLVVPAVAFAAPPIGDPLVATPGAITRMTTPWSLAHVPALSLPAGADPDGLPIGVQLVARPWADATVLRAAIALQDATDWHRRRPG